MKTNSHSENLALRIEFLESRQHLEWLEIKDHVTTIKENLKPLNILKNVVGGIKDTIGVGANSNNSNNGSLLKTAFGLGVEFLIHKIVVKKSQSKFRSFIGLLLSLAVPKILDRLKTI